MWFVLTVEVERQFFKSLGQCPEENTNKTRKQTNKQKNREGGKGLDWIYSFAMANSNSSSPATWPAPTVPKMVSPSGGLSHDDPKLCNSHLWTMDCIVFCKFNLPLMKSSLFEDLEPPYSEAVYLWGCWGKVG